jgi:GNAT superfamily N-acetyltransferase
MADLRLGAPRDLPVLVSYWHAMLQECGLVGSGLVPGWEGRLEEQFAFDMQAGSGTWFLAEEGGKVVGTCAVFRQMGRSQILLDVTAMVAGMYVLPEYRGRGIARALMAWVLAWCREHGVKTIRLNASKAGRPLYESMGFVTATEMMRLELR